jgi:hypothetical protein
MNVYNFTRVQTKYGDLIGFFYQDELAAAPEFFHPWQVTHMRLTSYENIFHPYGRSILNGSRKHFKQLRLMEDAAIIYRLTRAPEKRIFTIPVGQIPTHEVPNYIERIASRFKKKRFFDPATGDVNERWHPLIQEDDFWLPQRPDGTGPKVDTLPGAENLDQIADIEYFKKKMISGLKIPFSRVGIGEPGENDSKALAQVAPEFAKAVQWVQREVIMGLKKVAVVHLALKGYSERDIKSFSLSMTASSAIDELYRIETWSSRADVIDALKGTELFPDEWILRRFTDMTDDEIEEVQEKKAQAAEEAAALGEIEGEEGGGPPPLEGYDYNLERLLTEALFTHGNGRVRKKKELLNSNFEYMLNNNELDGLRKGPDNEVLLIETAVPKEEWEDAKRSTEQLLISTQPEPERLIPANID